jgi:hypothetical protein
MNAPPVQYADSSGVEIAYQVLGDDPLDLVWVAGAITHLDVLWEHRATSASAMSCEDRGQTALKGIPGEWRLFALSGGI